MTTVNAARARLSILGSEMAQTARPHAPHADGFDALDLCHRETVVALGKLAALVTRLAQHGADEASRALARAIVEHFDGVARPHHEDEERHVFPGLIARGDPALTQAVLRLQQDHDWLEEDWLEIGPHVAAVAAGQSWYDTALLREGAAVFSSLSIEHMALEESLIYPEARTHTGTAARHEMAREMAARCHGARTRARR